MATKPLYPRGSPSLSPQDVGLQAGQGYEVGLPDGTGRIVYWGDGTTLSLADSTSSTFATHTFAAAGSYTPTATGLWSNLGGQMNFVTGKFKVGYIAIKAGMPQKSGSWSGSEAGRTACRRSSP